MIISAEFSPNYGQVAFLILPDFYYHSLHGDFPNIRVFGKICADSCLNIADWELLNGKYDSFIIVINLDIKIS